MAYSTGYGLLPFHCLKKRGRSFLNQTTFFVTRGGNQFDNFQHNLGKSSERVAFSLVILNDYFMPEAQV